MLLTAITYSPLAPGLYLLLAASAATVAAILGLPSRDQQTEDHDRRLTSG